MRLTVRIETYRYNGGHRHWDWRARKSDPKVNHWDWRYKIMLNGRVIATYQGFCSYERVCRSAADKMSMYRELIFEDHAAERF